MPQNHLHPVLVTGAHRSGTTLVGRILSIPSQVAYVSEPFSKKDGLRNINRWFLYLKPGIKDESIYCHLIQGLLKGKMVYKRLPVSQGKTLKAKAGRLILGNKNNLNQLKLKTNRTIKTCILKDPIASMASEYLHRTFGMDTVILIRHPAAFVYSLKRLQWEFDFDEFFLQEELMADHLQCILNRFKIDNLSSIERCALLWKCIYSVLFCYLERNPGMIGIKHESLSSDPLGQFRYLYSKLNIEFTLLVEAKIRQLTSERNPVLPVAGKAHSLKRNSKEIIKLWKCVLPEYEVKQIREITEDVAGLHYADEDW